MLTITFKTTILLAVVWPVMLLLRRKSAALRHEIWTFTLAAVLLLPCLATILPAWRVPLKSSRLAETVLFRTEARAGQGVGRNLSALPSALSHFNATSDWIGTVWALGVAVSLGQMLVGWLAVRRMRRSATMANIPEFDAVRQAFGVTSDVELWETPSGSMPITYGLTRQTILLPADANEWNDGRRRAVLSHELAHVRRHDAAKQLLARVTLAMYWWHPFVWVAWREFLKERERAADDLVLGLGSNATDYASHLLAIARSMHSPDACGWAAIAMARPSQLEGRLSAILDARRDRKTPRPGSTAIAFAATLIIVAPWAALQARAVTGQTNTAGVASTPNSAAMALVAQGKTALSQKNYEAAFELFARAQASDSKLTGEAEMWQAITREAQGNLESATSLYKEALAATPDSSDAATIGELYAALLTKLNRNEEAHSVSAQAASIREFFKDMAAQTVQLSPDDHKIGGDVKAPILLSKVEPEYAPDAKLAKYSGAVLLVLEIGTDGIARNITVLRGLGLGLDQKAVDAVKQWRFKPGTLNGSPVLVQAHVEVNFKLL